MSLSDHDLIADLVDELGEDPDLILAALKLIARPEEFELAQKRTHTPVPIRQFIEDPYFLDKSETIWPEVMVALEELNNGDYLEGVLTGGIGTAKSTIALYSTAYQLYLLSCLHDPHADFDLDPSSEIVIIFQSLNAKQAKAVSYDRFRHMLLGSPYFSKHFPFDRSIESEMRFPNRIIVKPVSGDSTAAIGQNIVGGILDEVNFQSIVKNSKQSIDGGSYDQAMANYQSLARRRESRFMHKGTMPGLVCLVSSARYPGQFTDKKVEERDRQLSLRGSTTIYVYDKRVWEIAPEGRFGPERFPVFLGTVSRKPEIVDDLSSLTEEEQKLVLNVPTEYRSQFETNIYDSIRDIAGNPTQALHPFMPDAGAVAEAFGVRKSLLSRDDCDFKTTNVEIFPGRFEEPTVPRFVHIDLSITSDSTGVAIGRVSKFIDINRGTYSETLPIIVFDAILEVKPPKGGEIIFGKIRELLYKLRKLGLNIKWVSLDSYQSVDTRQILAGQNFITGNFSLDTSPLGYDITKTAFYDRRIQAPSHPKALLELVSLERDPKTGKVDHRPDSSKDVSDAIAGCVYGLTTRREIWHRHKIPINKIPSYLIGKTKEDPK